MELEAAKTKLQAIKTKTRTASVFINDIRTPLVFELYVEETPPGESGWVWKPVKVIAPEDAASDAGKVWRQILAGTPLPGIRSFKLGIGDAGFRCFACEVDLDQHGQPGPVLLGADALELLRKVDRIERMNNVE